MAKTGFERTFKKKIKTNEFLTKIVCCYTTTTTTTYGMNNLFEKEKKGVEGEINVLDSTLK